MNKAIEALRAQVAVLTAKLYSLIAQKSPPPPFPIVEEPSPNYFSRDGYKPEMVVIHCTDGTYPWDLRYLCNRDPQGGVGPVSSHYFIDPIGTIYRLVAEKYGAWHAGRVENPTVTLKKNQMGVYVNPNKWTIGIETSLKPPKAPTFSQIQSLAKLVKDICDRNGIPKDRAHIVGHHEIFEPKTCPGTIDVDALVAAVNSL